MIHPARTLPRMVATDLDGTLIGAGFAVSRRNAVALARASAAGAAVVLVTGRPIRWLPLVYADLGADYPAVCANGAVVYDPVENRVRDSWPVPAADVAEVCARLRAKVPTVLFAAEVDGGRRLLHEPAWPVRGDADSGAYPADLEVLAARPAVKLLARDPGRDSDSFNQVVAETVGDLVEATHSSYSGVVEMSRRGVTKATGLARVAAELGIAATDVLAFGDMPNDVSMLTWAGWSVAVANAHPLARAAADDVTLSNVDDGVAAYLETLPLGSP